MNTFCLPLEKNTSTCVSDKCTVGASMNTVYITFMSMIPVFFSLVLQFGNG